MSKEKSIIEINKINSRVRVICFGENAKDPYVIFHPEEEMLSDKMLNELWERWKAAEAEPGDNEEFEAFLDWLEENHGYASFLTAGYVFNFNQAEQ